MLAAPKPGLLLEAVRDGLAHKVRVVGLVRRLSRAGLVQAAGLSPHRGDGDGTFLQRAGAQRLLRYGFAAAIGRDYIHGN